MGTAVTRRATAQPRISVLMCVRNGERYLREAIDSVLAQTEPLFELIVIDDVSSDSTPTILEQYSAADERVRVFRNSERGGVAGARTAALSRSQAPLVAVFDADDLMMPTRLARQVAAFDAHPTVGVIGSAGMLIDTEGRTTGSFSCPVQDAAIRFRMTVGGAFWNTTTAYRADLLRSLQGYRREYEGSEDYDLWARLLSVSEGLNLDEPLVAQRIHPESVTAHSTKPFESHCRVSARVMEEYLGTPVAESDARAVVTLLHYAWRLRMSRDEVAAARVMVDRLASAARPEVDDAAKQWLRERVTRGLFLQARLQSSSNKALGWRLAGDYVAANPAGLLTSEVAGLVASLLLPRSVRRAARAMRGRADQRQAT